LILARVLQRDNLAACCRI